jgi:hypothetical protein
VNLAAHAPWRHHILLEHNSTQHSATNESRSLQPQLLEDKLC